MSVRIVLSVTWKCFAKAAVVVYGWLHIISNISCSRKDENILAPSFINILITNYFILQLKQFPYESGKEHGL